MGLQVPAVLQSQQIEKVTSTPSGVLQRACACGRHSHSSGECAECRKKRLALQRRTINQTGPTTAPPIVHQVLGSAGRPLDSETRAFMEPRFGHDFSQVRVHTDEQAAASAQSVNALAYTVGQDIVFNTGQYTPQSHQGRQLLAHELVHTLQQADNIQRKINRLTICPTADAYEREANHLANSVMKETRQQTSKPRQVQPSVQRACGSTEIGTPAGCTVPPDYGAFVEGRPLFRFNINCDTFAVGEDSNLSAFARRLPANATVEIHGFASVDGDPGLNHNLACARALAAKDQLTAPGPIGGGLNGSQIVGIINHGPTPGPAAERRSVVLEANIPPNKCGPDATDWYARQVNTASTDRDVVAIRTELAVADVLARRHGTTAQQIAEGGAAAAVVAEESRLGSSAPTRTPTATRQIRAGQLAGTAAAASLIMNPLDAAAIGTAITTAAVGWRRLVNHGARYDFKAHTMSRPSTSQCPDQACTNSITLCLGAAPENCYLTDLPGNLFYAQIGRFVGWSELTLQLGSQLAQLTGTASWDPPQDTAAIHLGFLLPVPMRAPDLCRVLPPARSSINSVSGCADCTQPTTAAIK